MTLASKAGSLRNHSSRNWPYSGSLSWPNQKSRTSPALLGTADNRDVFVATEERSSIHASRVAVYHPQLGHYLGDQLAVVEHPHHRALRDDHGDRVRLPGDGSACHVTAAQSERQVEAIRGRVYV